MDITETYIVQHLITNQEFFATIIPFLNVKYFSTKSCQILVNQILDYYNEYKICITRDILRIKINTLKDVPKEIIDECNEFIKSLDNVEKSELKPLLDLTESYFRNQLVKDVLSEGMIKHSKNQVFDADYIKKMEKAATFGFDFTLGYDYETNFESRVESYKENVIKIPTSLGLMNEMTNGGVNKGTLNVCLATTGGGKTIWLTQEAGFHYKEGRNVLYITLEMDESEISKRIDANLLNIAQDELKNYSIQSLKVTRDREIRNPGKLIIKQYPARSITALNISQLIDELKTKKNIVIDVLVVDYINLLKCMTAPRGAQRHEIVRYIAEELRGLAVEKKIPIWTASQLNRSGASNNPLEQVGMSMISESWGIPETSDFVFTLIQPGQIPGNNDNNKYAISIDKNRYSRHKKDDIETATVLVNTGLSKISDDPNRTVVTNKDKESKKKNVKAIAEKNKKVILNDKILGDNDDLF